MIVKMQYAALWAFAMDVYCIVPVRGYYTHKNWFMDSANPIQYTNNIYFSL